MKSVAVLECSACNNNNCLIKKNSLDSDINSFLKEKRMFNVGKSKHFILEGAPVHGLFFVYEGKVKVVKTGINGREQIVRFAQQGEIIGHRGFGAGEYYQIGAVALEDTILCSFSSSILMEALKRLPKLTFDFMTFYSEELNRSETKVRKIAQMTVRERVIDSLLYINRKFGKTKEWLSVQLTRREIADFAGTTDEQVIRVISSLKKDGLIKTSGKKIAILDFDKLKNEISEHNYFLDS